MSSQNSSTYATVGILIAEHSSHAITLPVISPHHNLQIQTKYHYVTGESNDKNIQVHL